MSSVGSTALSLAAEVGLSRSKIVEGEAANERLASMGLKSAYFREAALHGIDRKSRVTEFHPKTYPGQVMYHETTAGLRIQLVSLQEDWRISSIRNYETVFHPINRMAITVINGDTNTGVRDAEQPKTLRARGPMAQNRIKRNRDQLELDLGGITKVVETAAECDTWFYLLNVRKGVLYNELSLPIDGGLHRRVSRWAERILMEPIDLEGAVNVSAIPEEPDEPHTVVVGRKR